MKKNQLIGRRKFLAGTIIIPTISLSEPLFAQNLPKVDERDPSAAALGFKHNAASIDSMAFPQRSMATDGDTQFCNNCALYTADDEQWGVCALFPGKSVAAQGWCNVWSLKPA